MKRLAVLIMMLILLPAFCVIARNNVGFQENNSPPPQNYNLNNSQSKQTGMTNRQVVINVSRPSSGGHNRNFPLQQQRPVQQHSMQAASYSKLQWNTNNHLKQPALNRTQAQQPFANTISSAGVNAASVVHHHPYEQNYVRKKLQKIGVLNEPGYIANRQEIIHTNREHSMIAYPSEGYNRQHITASAVSSRHFNDKIVRTQMSLVVGASWQGRISRFNENETLGNHYYWHHDVNFDYCHYVDNWGYHWYGWYVGRNYFWTRYFENRWWWYDTDYDRWCFWNDGFWWWQDPYHIGDLYCYNNVEYIPVNSAQDNVAVTAPNNNNNMRTFTSPDNTRNVKVITDTEDAFLYDTANPPAFSPIYLASGVQDVMFSDIRNGRPLEIILKLNDGSFDMFDSNGNSYNPGE